MLTEYDRFVQQRTLYATEVLRHVEALREALVRHDENLKAYRMLDECVPYFLRAFPEYQRMLDDQRQMVLHLLDPAEYEEYYGNNPYEQPFEKQYGGRFTVETASGLPRVAWLVDRLTEYGKGRLYDFGCNDGWMLAHLLQQGLVRLDSAGVDLAGLSVARGRFRVPSMSLYVGRIEEAPHTQMYDYVTCFEVLEHVLDPVAVCKRANHVLGPNGRFFCSTPLGACELGWVPEWDKVERKGHVRAADQDEVRDWLVDAGFTNIVSHVDDDGLILTEAIRG